MIGEALRAVDGAAIYPVLSLLLFVASFAFVLFRVIRMDRTDVKRFSRLPLDGRDDVSLERGTDNE